MVRTITFAVCVGALAALGGCTTVNFGGQGRATAIDEASLTQPQRDLRAAVGALESRADDQGWSSGDGMAAAAARAIDVLLHGWKKADENASPEEPKDRLQDYVRQAAASDTPDAALLGDLAEIESLVQDVNGAANQIAVMSNLDRAAVADDIRHVESAMATARRAESFFLDVTSQLAPRLSDDQRKSARARLATLNTEIARMSDLADALNAARAAGGFEVG